MRTGDRSHRHAGPGRRASLRALAAFLILSGAAIPGRALFPRAAAAEPPPDPEIQSLDSQNRVFERVAQSVTPAIVSVQTTHVVHLEDCPAMKDSELHRFFGDVFGQTQVPAEQKEEALGSGVIVSPSGYIVTNNHLLAQATDIEVQLADGRIFKGRIVGTDAQTDVAVLQIDAQNLPTITWGQSSALKVGNTVLAFGNPFGLNFTVTRGMVSAVGRSGLGIENMEDFIQTDAAINPGNSGGALVDVHGAVIGINTAIVGLGVQAGGGGFNGVGLAIPSDIVRRSAESLISTGKVKRGYLGATLSSLTPRLARQFHVPDVAGALVQDLDLGSPAERAGVKVGDVIRSLNARPVDSEGQITSQISTLDPGTRITLGVLREGRPLSLSVALAELPSDQAESPPAPSKEPDQATLSGLTVQDPSNEARAQLGLAKEIAGVVITAIDPASPAAADGLQPGDVILEIDHHPIRNVDDFARLGARTSDVLLRIDRRGDGAFIVISADDGAGD